LALEKNDYALAAESYERAAKLTPDDPDVHLGLARSYAASQPQRATESLARALELNPSHPDSLLMQADQLIDSERYTQAKAMLDKVFATNAAHPEAWAYRAVVAHLEGDPSGEKLWRQAALKPWATNPAVDHLIGRELSQKYRFAEGVAYQRRALELDPGSLSVKLQLAQDLLRLGQEEEGWRLAEEVNRLDGYSVAAHNLVTLRETLAKFTTLEQDGLLLRMDAHEAKIYGQSALELLLRAKAEISAKYGVELPRPIIVEIFPEQKDFAVRTFGMPGGEGFLGVCFGNVITANSPASQGAAPSNWKSVLWHEFCHVVTLCKSKNKMPRWLSEGISVYEEKQEDPAWGQSMNGHYRAKVLDGGLVPVSQLSAAFLDPPSPLDLDFAYYESSLAVEYLLETHGAEAVKGILDDLSIGMPISEALSRHAGPPAALDDGFAAYAKQRALAIAPEADWDPPPLEPDAELTALAEFHRQHPTNLAGLQLLAQRLIEQESWREALPLLEESLRLYPENVGTDNPYLLLARVHRALADAASERAVLERLAGLDADAVAVQMRLIELAQERQDWEAAAKSAERILAVNPLLRVPHRTLAKAAEALGTPARAIQSYQALLEMDPIDPAGTHFQLARLLHQQGHSDLARRHVLMALEEAPRFREAHRLLLEIVDHAVAAEPDVDTPGENSPSPAVPPAQSPPAAAP
jgi:tetratricopeptide (TPR) repeat protein